MTLGAKAPAGLPRIVVALGNVTEVMGLLPYLEELAGRAAFAVMFSEEAHEAAFSERIARLPFSRIVSPPVTVASRWEGQADNLGALLPWAREFLREFNPSIVLSGSDRDVRKRVVVLKAAHEQSIPIMVLPAALPAMAESLIRRRDGPDNAVRDGDPILKRHPQHVRQNAASAMVSFYRNEYYRIYEGLDLIRGNPWALGGVWADVLLSPSRSITEQSIANGLPTGKIRTVGSLEQDKLASQLARRDQLRESLLGAAGFSNTPDSVVVSWAVHQYAEHNVCTAERSLEIMNQVAESFAALNVVVLASLHPKMERDRYAWIEEDHQNIALVDEPLHHWIGAADLAVAAGYSSTATWSAALGVPSLVYDFLGLNDDIYRDMRAVRVVSDRSTFCDTVESAAHRDGAWQRWLADAIAHREASGILDGKAMERVAAALGISPAETATRYASTAGEALAVAAGRF